MRLLPLLLPAVLAACSSQLRREEVAPLEEPTAASSALSLAPAPPFSAQDDGLTVRVVDVGAGLCCVARWPGEDGDFHYMVYDAGNYVDRGATAMAAIREIYEDDDDPTLDVLVLSHSDADHLGAVDAAFVGVEPSQLDGGLVGLGT